MRVAFSKTELISKQYQIADKLVSCTNTLESEHSAAWSLCTFVINSLRSYMACVVKGIVFLAKSAHLAISKTFFFVRILYQLKRVFVCFRLLSQNICLVCDFYFPSALLPLLFQFIWHFKRCSIQSCNCNWFQRRCVCVCLRSTFDSVKSMWHLQRLVILWWALIHTIQTFQCD